MTDTRWCPHCEAERPLSEFYVNKAAASGIDGYCKDYRKEKQRDRSRKAAERKKLARAEQGLPEVQRRSHLRIDDDGRQCVGCEAYKPWIEFHLDRTSSTGHQTTCKSCVRDRQQVRAATEEGRQARRRHVAAYRARRRGPGWQPRQVTRHAQLECDGTKHRCTQCGFVKNVTLFPRNKQTPCGFDPRCSSCRHQRRVERRATNHNDILTKETLNWSLTKYGITADDYHWLLAEQDGGCRLCGKSESFAVTLAGTKSRLSVDHDHEHCGPGRACKECIRGLLCHDCNFGLGKFEYKERTRVFFSDYLALRPFMRR